MSTILTKITDNKYGYDKRLHIKGAAEIILRSCNQYINEEGGLEPLDEDMTEYINENVIEEFAKKALRTI